MNVITLAQLWKLLERRALLINIELTTEHAIMIDRNTKTQTFIHLLYGFY